MRSLPGRWWSCGEIRALPGRDPVIGLLTVRRGARRHSGPLNSHERGYSADDESQVAPIADYRRHRPPARVPARVVPSTSAATILGHAETSASRPTSGSGTTRTLSESARRWGTSATRKTRVATPVAVASRESERLAAPGYASRVGAACSGEVGRRGA